MNTELVTEGTNEDQANNEKEALSKIAKTDRSKPPERHLNKPRQNEILKKNLSINVVVKHKCAIIGINNPKAIADALSRRGNFEKVRSP